MLQECIQIHQLRTTNLSQLHTFFSPGRVNLIGEHIDYNGGLVMPIAISLGNVGCLQLREDNKIILYSENFKELGSIECSLDDLNFKKEDGWANYAKGVIKRLIELGYVIDKGFEITVFGNLPIGAGLSSSASIEALVAIMMKKCFLLDVSNVELAKITKAVENNYIGVNCGIMDQFVILNAEDEKAMLLNTVTLSYDNVRFNLGQYEIVVINSKVSRGLVDSKYNERRNECNQALNILQRELKIENLCDLTPDEFIPFEHKLGPLLFQRAKHAVTEQDRTKKAFTALKANDILSFGKLLTKSHESLSKDYAVSIAELDALVDIALMNGSIGSRMTGAGFGGCTVNIVKTDNVDYFITRVESEYNRLFHKFAECYRLNPSGSAREIKGEL